MTCPKFGNVGPTASPLSDPGFVQNMQYQSPFQCGEVFLAGAGGFVRDGHGKPASGYHGQHIALVVFSVVGYPNIG
jgi:hypothetical protein